MIDHENTLGKKTNSKTTIAVLIKSTAAGQAVLKASKLQVFYHAGY